VFNAKDHFRLYLPQGGHAKAGPLFDDNDLFEDFCRALQKLGLLRSSEKQALKKVKPAITLFALTAMHNGGVGLGDGSTAKLQITPDIKGRLAVFAIAEVAKDYGAGPVNMATWVFKTGLPVADYCEPGVAPPTRSPFVGDFEMTRQLKLARLP
jgi:hypothetical protein